MSWAQVLFLLEQLMAKLNAIEEKIDALSNK